ncbi:MAG: pyruvate ferredoxin oxidoreductase [Candidatus Micrarchaeia archaeon]
MRKTIEGSLAVAETVKNCDPDVVACYPITPSTHIAEELQKMYSDGEIRSFIAVESEFSAISALVGASAAGGRTFTATSSQGLALMHEVLFCAAGMRLPIVMVVANRSLSAPLSIWLDHQDAMSERDSGWIQIYCESNQEVADSVVQAFKIAESVYIPTMVCMDGFYLTHSVEQIEIPDKETIGKFLPPFKPAYVLDPKNPLTMGAYAYPEHYQSFREDLQNDIFSAKKTIAECGKEWGKLTGREYGLYEAYKIDDADFVLIGMGSLMGNTKVAVDELRAQGKKVGSLRIRSFRPFPYEISELLEGKKAVGVFDRALSLGGTNPLFAEVVASLIDHKKLPRLSSFVGGLGGRDVTVEHIKGFFKMLETNKPYRGFV